MKINVTNAHFFNDIDKLLDLHDFGVKDMATQSSVINEMLTTYSYLDPDSVVKTINKVNAIGGVKSYKFAKHIFNLMRQQNDLAFRMAISELMSKGINFYQEVSYDELYEAKGNALMTDAFAKDIMVFAKHLSRLDHIHLLVYVSRNVEWGSYDEEELSYDRYKTIAENACMVATNAAFEYEGSAAGIDVLEEIGLDEEEMKVLGYGWALENKEE